MKTIRNITLVLLFLLAVTSGFNLAFAQDKPLFYKTSSTTELVKFLGGSDPLFSFIEGTGIHPSSSKIGYCNEEDFGNISKKQPGGIKLLRGYHARNGKIAVYALKDAGKVSGPIRCDILSIGINKRERTQSWDFLISFTENGAGSGPK